MTTKGRLVIRRTLPAGSAVDISIIVTATGAPTGRAINIHMFTPSDPSSSTGSTGATDDGMLIV
jgi:hypothetical protein